MEAAAFWEAYQLTNYQRIAGILKEVHIVGGTTNDAAWLETRISIRAPRFHPRC